MPMHLLFENIKEKHKADAIRDLIADSTPRPSFFFLVGLSILMATFGLLINNASVIIGSMLIAPIMSPLLSLSLGIVTAESRIITRSAYTLLKATGYAIGFAVLATWLFGISEHIDLTNPEIIARTQPSIIYLMIAIVSGIATAFARVKPEINETLPGTAIAVALVPPIAVAGIGIATFDWTMATGALQMFILNGIGVVLAAMFMFSLMNLYTKRALAAGTQSREDARLAREIEEAKRKNGNSAKK